MNRQCYALSGTFVRRTNVPSIAHLKIEALQLTVTMPQSRPARTLCVSRETFYLSTFGHICSNNYNRFSLSHGLGYWPSSRLRASYIVHQPSIPATRILELSVNGTKSPLNGFLKFSRLFAFGRDTICLVQKGRSPREGINNYGHHKLSILLHHLAYYL